MSQNPYVAPSSVAAEPPAPASLTGRILAPLLVPLLLVPTLLGLVVVLYEGSPLWMLGPAILNFLPVALLCMFLVAPLVMLALLPFRRWRWLKRGLLATLIQVVLIGVLLAASFFYFGDQPVEVQLPQRVG